MANLSGGKYERDGQASACGQEITNTATARSTANATPLFAKEQPGERR